MVEVPDYLLQRSRDRRSALGLGGDDDAGDSPAPAADSGGGGGAVEKAAAPAGKAPVPVPPAAEPEPEAVRPEVQAAQRKKRVPVWAMPVLAALPLWAGIYAFTLEPPTEETGGILAEGAEIYGQCAACHGAAGGGGVGPAMAGGAVLETFPELGDHLEWVRLGSTNWSAEVGDTYGANATPVSGGMPGFEALTEEELLSVILYERAEFGGEDLVAAGIIDEEGNLVPPAESPLAEAEGPLGPALAVEELAAE